MGKTWQECFRYLKNRRDIHPNRGFQRQLQEYSQNKMKTIRENLLKNFTESDRAMYAEDLKYWESNIVEFEKGDYTPEDYIRVYLYSVVPAEDDPKNDRTWEGWPNGIIIALCKAFTAQEHYDMANSGLYI